jgi:hypothetical protein
MAGLLRVPSHVRYAGLMRTSSLPPIRVEPEFRSRIEGVLKEGETLSSLILSAVRQEVTRRINVAEFHKRGFESLTHARETGAYFAAEEVLPGLEARLAAAKAQGRD